MILKSLVSIEVIVPVYNTEKYLSLCLSSLINQTFEDWHATIIDDGSTDGSAGICKSFCEQYPDKFSYYFARHKGPGGARNYALDYCGITAKALYFLDSDDYIDSEMLEEMFNAMNSDNSEIVVCGYIRHYINKQQKFIYHRSGVIDSKELCISLFEGEEIGNFPCNKLFRRELFQDIRFPEGSYYEDVAVIYKAILKSKKISVVQKAFYHYVWHKGSIVCTNDIQYLKDLRAAVLKRNNDIVKEFPDLKGQAEINELEKDIYIFNQICRKSDKDNSQYYAENLKLIKSKSYLYKKLNRKYKLMAYLIKFCPRAYCCILSGLKNVHL